MCIELIEPGVCVARSLYDGNDWSGSYTRVNMWYPEPSLGLDLIVTNFVQDRNMNIQDDTILGQLNLD